jgi:integrase
VPRPAHREMRTLSDAELRQLFQVTAKSRMHALWVLLATTGLRLGEALGLTWQDIDSSQGRLVVNKALQRVPGRGPTLVEPKTRRSRRIVYLAPSTVTVLMRHRRGQVEEQLSAGSRWQANDFIFTSQSGSPIDPHILGDQFRRALSEAGLPRIRIHDLRHTAATHLLGRGVHPKIVQELLGHSTITLTLDTYSHVAPGMHAQVADHMEALFRFPDARVSV